VAAARSEVAAPKLLLRPMLEADVPAVVALESASYQFPWSEGIFRDCLRVGYLCRVVEISDRPPAVAGTVVGYGIMSMGAGEAHILNLCVRADLRSRGIGRQVLDNLLARARAAGMLEAFLEVRPTNVAAIRLYQAAGFEQVGIRRGYYQAAGGREDAAVLKLELAGERR
jgi:[ribosomal protein S18]-alanine N-acetyltransferase